MTTIEPARWGATHFSVIVHAYRCERANHGQPARLSANRLRTNGVAHPTHLADGTTVPAHSNLDCLHDADAAGVLAFVWPRVWFTPEGAKLGAWLCAWWDAADAAQRLELTWDQALAESGAVLPISVEPST